MIHAEMKTNRLEIIHPPKPSYLRLPPADESQHPGDEYELIGHVFDAKMYATESLVDELKVIRNLGWRANHNLYHATSSIALGAIARRGALLSSKRLMAEDEPITTGEITTEMGDFHRHFGGLKDVYASNSPIDTKYAKLSSNSEYPVIFGIDKESVRDRLFKSLDVGDGIKLGPEVPLEYINTQIVRFDNMPDIQSNSALNNQTKALTMSWDAAFVLNHQDY